MKIEIKLIKKKKERSLKTGFTLIEIMIAIFVMAVGIISVYALVPKTISIVSSNSDRFVASQLAKEAVEIIRNIRDSNWLSGNSFDNGLSDGSWAVQYNKDFLLGVYNNFLLIDSQGFFNYDGGTVTKFKRKITLSHPEAWVLKVKAEVSWQGKGSPFELEDSFYNWR
jgi:prepilin-type N-terminal cleavage/methylation domain-containing protein